MQLLLLLKVSGARKLMQIATTYICSHSVSVVNIKEKIQTNLKTQKWKVYSNWSINFLNAFSYNFTCLIGKKLVQLVSTEKLLANYMNSVEERFQESRKQNSPSDGTDWHAEW
jgi:hypothetical protein